jgi:hypothetical protein
MLKKKKRERWRKNRGGGGIYTWGFIRETTFPEVPT